MQAKILKAGLRSDLIKNHKIFMGNKEAFRDKNSKNNIEKNKHK